MARGSVISDECQAMELESFPTSRLVRNDPWQRSSFSHPLLLQSISKTESDVESSSNGVPIDDLSILRGCVSRNRAVFSPTPLIHKQSVKLTGTWPDLISSHEFRSPLISNHNSADGSHGDQPVDTKYSVSVQLKRVGCCETSLPNNQSSLSRSNHPGIPQCEEPSLGDSNHLQLFTNSLSTPSRLNSPSLRLFKLADYASESHSSCSCAAYMSERMITDSIRIPVARTNSLDGRETVKGLSQKSHRKDCLGEATSSCGSQGSLLSYYTFQDGSSYVKGVDGQVFKDRMKTVQKWFSESNDQQRNMILLNLLDQCTCAQMHLLSLHMEPILHHLCPVNCQDLLSWLPSNLAFYILSFLDPVSLCRASQVSRIWCHMASDYRLWMKLCRSYAWQLSQMGEEKQRRSYISTDGSVMWKAMFSERFRIRRNWLKGYCNVRTFEGHTQGISCIQFDGTRIVSGSWDKTIKVWNRRTNTAWAALTLAGHSGTVRCLHLHENRLVSGSSDRTIKVWDLSTDNVNWVGATCKTTMVGHMHTVRCLQADHEKVISGSYDNTLKVWDLSTGICSLTLRGHGDAVLCLHFHGIKLVSGSMDTTIKVWNLSRGCCQLTLHGHQAAVTCVQFDDTRVISGAVDRLIKIWSIENGQCLRTIDWIRSEGHTGVIRHLQADRWKIVSAADDKTLKVWSLKTGNRLLTLKSHTDGVTCLQFNDEVIVSGSYDKTVKLWDFSVC